MTLKSIKRAGLAVAALFFTTALPSHAQESAAQAAPPARQLGPTISADFPFSSNFIEVKGSRMHYVDVGEGDPILLSQSTH